MTSFRQLSHRGRRLSRATLALAFAVGLLAGPTGADAQSGASGVEMVRAGASAVDKGDYAGAVKRLNGAISSDKLTSEEMSKALYYRGIAYRQMGRLGESVSDFNGALWMRGLTTNQRAQAKLYLGLAYRSAGKGDLAKKALNEAKKLSPNDERVAAALAGSNVEPERRSSLPSIRSFFGRDGTKEQASDAKPESEQAAAPEPAKPPEEKRPQVAAIPNFRTTVAPADPEPATPAPPPSLRKAAREDAPEVTSNWSTSVAPEPKAPREVASLDTGQPETDEEKGRIGRFFKSIWDSDEDKGETTPEQTAAEQTPPAADWAKSTRVEEFNESAQAGAKRSYRVQLASSRSEKEARDYWSRLTRQHASVLAGREPVIEKTDLGTLGTFYRLQVGPFDEKQEPLRLCNDFKRNGLDCFLVAR